MLVNMLLKNALNVGRERERERATRWNEREPNILKFALTLRGKMKKRQRKKSCGRDRRTVDSRALRGAHFFEKKKISTIYFNLTRAVSGCSMSCLSRFVNLLRVAPSTTR